jgi:hypothetical protein
MLRRVWHCRGRYSQDMRVVYACQILQPYVSKESLVEAQNQMQMMCCGATYFEHAVEHIKAIIRRHFSNVAQSRVLLRTDGGYRGSKFLSKRRPVKCVTNSASATNAS